MHTPIARTTLLALALFTGSAYAAPLAISSTEQCEGGGTRTVAGSYDASSGALDVTVTLAACVGRPQMNKTTTSATTATTTTTASATSTTPTPGTTGSNGNRSPQPGTGTQGNSAGQPTADGTETIKGSMLLASGTVYNLDLTDTAIVKLSFSNSDSMQRNCTVTHKGSFDTKTNLFTGTLARNNCTMSGTYPEQLGLVEHLLRNASSTDGL